VPGPSELRFAGRRGVVTGAGSGLGREVLLGLVAEGADVVAADVDLERGERVVDEAAGAPGRAVFQHCDVAQEQDVSRAVDRCVEEFGGLDLIHNNAGIQGSARFHETSTELWDRVQDVNLKAVFWGCKYAIAAMRQGGAGGSIVNTASMLALVGDPYLPAYTAAKTGVLGLTRAIAVDYGPERIRANCVCPGDMDTPCCSWRPARPPSSPARS
jgi:meso-butanediol dehydrogenase / (S,S)-butanediol dehydrogenase / diacetyl reductase